MCVTDLELFFITTLYYSKPLYIVPLHYEHLCARELLRVLSIKLF